MKIYAAIRFKLYNTLLTLRKYLKRKLFLLGLKICKLAGANIEPDMRIPVLDIKQVPDYEWQKESYESRLKNPQIYRDLGEDVEASLERMKKWLDTHKNEDGAGQEAVYGK